MASNRTSNMRMNDWAGTDGIRRQEIGANFKAIDQDIADRGVNPKWIGAKGDGLGDDTANLQTAADALAGKDFFLPYGTYLTDGLLLPANTKLTCARGTVLKSRGGTGHVLTLSSGCSVEGLEIHGNKAVKTTGSGIVANGAVDVEVIGCFVHDTAEAGIYMKTSNNQIRGNRTDSIYRRNFTGYLGRIENNVSSINPNAAISPTLF